MSYVREYVPIVVLRGFLLRFYFFEFLFFVFFFLSIFSLFSFFLLLFLHFGGAAILYALDIVVTYSVCYIGTIRFFQFDSIIHQRGSWFGCPVGWNTSNKSMVLIVIAKWIGYLFFALRSSTRRVSTNCFLVLIVCVKRGGRVRNKLDIYSVVLQKCYEYSRICFIQYRP